MSRPAQRALCHAEQSLDDDDEHGGLDADERRLDEGHLTEKRIGDAEREHDQGARKDEQQARGKSAQGAVQAPTDIGRELHGFGTRQQHAEIERVQKMLFVDPFALVHQHAMHQRDLSGRAAEGQHADLRPDGERLPEGGWLSRMLGVEDASGPMAAHSVVWAQSLTERRLGECLMGRPRWPQLAAC